MSEQSPGAFMHFDAIEKVEVDGKDITRYIDDITLDSYGPTTDPLPELAGQYRTWATEAVRQFDLIGQAYLNLTAAAQKIAKLFGVPGWVAGLPTDWYEENPIRSKMHRQYRQKRRHW